MGSRDIKPSVINIMTDAVFQIIHLLGCGLSNRSFDESPEIFTVPFCVGPLYHAVLRFRPESPVFLFDAV